MKETALKDAYDELKSLYPDREISVWDAWLHLVKDVEPAWVTTLKAVCVSSHLSTDCSHLLSSLTLLFQV